MRIGELASVVGVTTRAIRHYHQLGLLPEPGRRANGYRAYELRHAVVLARVRRLTELGLGLPEVRDVLADDAGRELVEVLAELDEDLARQETALRVRRERVGALLAEARAGRVPAEGPVSPELTALLAELERSAPADPGSPMAAKDRETLALLDATIDPADRERLLSALSGTVGSPDRAARAHQVYALLDALADADPADPRVDEAARALAALLPRELTEAAAGLLDVTDDSAATPPDTPRSFVSALFADLAPAQSEAVRRALAGPGAEAVRGALAGPGAERETVQRVPADPGTGDGPRTRPGPRKADGG
ncbi:MerR family DNA-binding transcriptional regulator [Streptomyces sp. SID4919]|uniref:MerR family transcriptional regulator n=1 Tax=unclassified Streptomyces TaxID=2593676 RepID=UPI000823D982|nr:MULTISPECIES: MerR family transcriptional regulator [unclassified Streptomyces]MYY13728.1 MerR family DNA-binding transcriptional regulator [Streptomyces sp. SID4919]SCK34580.1 DNA-binding transcriptional regulator, MerR family [Streptomyces sp. AmelKG-E11A]